MRSLKLPYLIFVGLAALHAPEASAAVRASTASGAAAAEAAGRGPARDARPAFAGDVPCVASRRRLWTEAEGWIVRRVAACR